MDKKSKSALIIGFGRMGQLYCQILKEFGYSIDEIKQYEEEKIITVES